MNEKIQPSEYLITREELTGGKDFPEAYNEFINDLLYKLNYLRLYFWKKPMKVSGSFRTKADQIRIYKAKAKKKQHPFTNGIYDENKVPFKSAHIQCRAVDFDDRKQLLCKYLQENPKVLEDCGLYMESPEYTKTWCHLQSNPPSSGKRIFIP